jgi:phosphoribosylformylglycinamidine synthase
MDLKGAGNVLYQVGVTKNELGGSHFALVSDLAGGNVPQVDPVQAKATFAALHQAIHAGYVRACHDLSEGGLAVAAAEMAFAGGLGARLYLEQIPQEISEASAAEVPGGLAAALLFSESNTRFLVEVPQEFVGHFEETLGDVPHAAIGEVLEQPKLIVTDVDPLAEKHLIETDLTTLKAAWQKPLAW